MGRKEHGLRHAVDLAIPLHPHAEDDSQYNGQHQLHHRIIRGVLQRGQKVRFDEKQLSEVVQPHEFLKGLQGVAPVQAELDNVESWDKP